MLPSTSTLLASRRSSARRSTAPRPPSPRDQAIFQALEVDRQAPHEVAERHDLTPAQLGRIVGRVRRWIALCGELDLPALPDPLARQRWQRAVEYQRLSDLHRRAIREADRLEAEREARSTRTRREAGEEKFVETTLRPQSCVPLLRVAQRAIEGMAKLSEREPLPPSPPAEPSDEDLRQALFDALCDQRQQAEDAERVPRSADLTALVANWLAALVGREPASLSPGFVPPDDAVRQLVRTFLQQPADIAGVPPETELLLQAIGCEADAPLPGSLPPSDASHPLPLGSR